MLGQRLMSDSENEMGCSKVFGGHGVQPKTLCALWTLERIRSVSGISCLGS